MDRTRQSNDHKAWETGSNRSHGAVHPAKEADFLLGITGNSWTSSEQRSDMLRSGRPSGCRMENGPSSKTGGGVVAGRGESEACWGLPASGSLARIQHGEGEKGCSLGPGQTPPGQTRLCCFHQRCDFTEHEKALIIASVKNKWDNVCPSDLQGLRHCRNISYQLFNYRSTIKSNRHFTLLSFVLSLMTRDRQ